MRVTVYCATTNPGKLREFEDAGGGICRFIPLPRLPELTPHEETGLTFEENAIQKALYYCHYVEGLVIAEDSGLEVDALQGAPGVHSARYAGPGASDEANNRLVLEKMKGREDRSARFVCVIALVRGGEVLGTFRGEVEGELLREPKGTEGFGYDPLFYYPPFGCSFGEVPREKKQAVSHRGRAIRELVRFVMGGFRIYLSPTRRRNGNPGGMR